MTGVATEITADLVRDLLRDQAPDLAELPIREVEGGWGNQMWRLGDDLAVRLPGRYRSRCPSEGLRGRLRVVLRIHRS